MIRTYPDPILGKKMPTRTPQDLGGLSSRMLLEMFRSGGVGLAAPQVGEEYRLFVADPEVVGRGVFFNPVLIEQSPAGLIGSEGCLSLPGVCLEVKRPEWIVVRFMDDKGTESEERFHGFPARVILHEMDHLDGVLMLDRVHALKRQRVLRKLR